MRAPACSGVSMLNIHLRMQADRNAFLALSLQVRSLYILSFDLILHASLETMFFY